MLTQVWGGAIALYEESLQLKRAIGNKQGIIATLHEIATVYRNQGNVDGAIVQVSQPSRVKDRRQGCFRLELGKSQL